MSRKRRMFFKAAQRDKAEPAIIKALVAVGATVWQLSGKDIPDLLVGYRGQTFLLEVKTPGLEYTDKRNGKTYKRDGALRTGQKEFFASWRGGPAREVLTPEEALMAVGAPVEGVLEPLTMSRIHRSLTVLPEPDDKPALIPIHPDSDLGQCLKTMGEIEIAAEQLASPGSFHVVTPAYQREQTAAVVPPKKRRKT